MKYMVEVNALYLVAVEAESALGAEHVVLDLGFWGALAYDKKELKTETFYAAVQNCRTISFDELAEIAEEYELAQRKVQEAKDALDAKQKEFDDFCRQLEKISAELKEAAKNKEDAEGLLSFLRDRHEFRD